LRRYDEKRGVLNLLRNQTVFHYPKGKSVRAISKAIEQAQNDPGAAGSEKSDKIKDARMFFADDLLARMVFNAAGGTEEAYAGLVQELAAGVRDFMKFTSAALDQLFIERLHRTG
jgi:hypothetical protein